MTDLETLLREHFSAEADAVPIQADLRGGVDRLRHERRRHHRFAGGASALAVAVIAAAIAVPLALLGHNSTNRNAVVSPNQTVATRQVVWGGITLSVPSTWSVGTFPCGTTHDAVVYPYDGPLPACPPMPAAPPSTQLLLQVNYPVPRGTAIVFAGLSAQRASVRAPEGLMGVAVYVPSRQATFTLVNASPETVQQIFGSARQ